MADVYSLQLLVIIIVALFMSPQQIKRLSIREIYKGGNL